MLTSRKTSHGPQKSMMTASSEITKATGIWPAGLSEWDLSTAELLTSPAFAETSVRTKRTSATTKLTLVAMKKNALLFMVRVDVFMVLFSRIALLAAMTTIIIFLPGRGFLSLSFDFRTSSFTRRPTFVYADDAAGSFQFS